MPTDEASGCLATIFSAMLEAILSLPWFGGDRLSRRAKIVIACLVGISVLGLLLYFLT